MNIVNVIGECIVPVMILVIISSAIISKCNAYTAFTAGIKSGVKSVCDIFPAIFALFIAVGMLRSSGILDWVTEIISPVTDMVGLPSGVLPFALLRPVSGSGSLAMASDIFAYYGADSVEGRIVSVMMGSTETTFYTTAVYFAASGTKNIRHALKCALAADIMCIFVSTAVCIWYY